MKLQDVINQALSDPIFAEELRVKAVQAFRDDVGSDAWEDFMQPFARDAAELACLRTLTSGDPNVDCTTGTRLTLTTTSTFACTMTTTTTTLSYFCP